MNKVNINGIDLTYRRCGKGLPIMLIHGFPLDSNSWNEIIQFLENDFDIIMPNLRGFGQSSTLETPYSISDMADDLAGLLNHLGIQKTFVAGHSMGGYVALAFAKKYQNRLNGLGLISSQAAGDPPDRKEGRYKTATDVSLNGVSVLVEVMSPKLSNDIRIQRFVRELIGKQSKSGVIGALKAMAEREDYLSFLSRSTLPVVLIHGDSDTLIPIARSKDILAVMPSAHFVELPGAGHMPMMEFAKETAEGLKLLITS